MAKSGSAREKSEAKVRQACIGSVSVAVVVAVLGGIVLFSNEEQPEPVAATEASGEVQQRQTPPSTTRRQSVPSSSSSVTTQRPNTLRSNPSQQRSMVFVAPQSGEKWHTRRDCRGLRNARQIASLTQTEAEQRGYEPCGLCSMTSTAGP